MAYNQPSHKVDFFNGSRSSSPLRGSHVDSCGRECINYTDNKSDLFIMSLTRIWSDTVGLNTIDNPLNFPLLRLAWGNYHLRRSKDQIHIIYKKYIIICSTLYLLDGQIIYKKLYALKCLLFLKDFKKAL